jgi:hypothetical protein
MTTIAISEETGEATVQKAEGTLAKQLCKRRKQTTGVAAKNSAAALHWADTLRRAHFGGVPVEMLVHDEEYIAGFLLSLELLQLFVSSGLPLAWIGCEWGCLEVWLLHMSSSCFDSTRILRMCNIILLKTENV